MWSIQGIMNSAVGTVFTAEKRPQEPVRYRVKDRRRQAAQRADDHRIEDPVVGRR
jgi:hypothetical protein